MTSSTVKAGTPSSFKVLSMERGCFGRCLLDWQGACMVTELDVQPAEPGVAVAQDVEGINVREGLMQFLLANN